jgi:hypothetical protein
MNKEDKEPWDAGSSAHFPLLVLHLNRYHTIGDMGFIGYSGAYHFSQVKRFCLRRGEMC